VEVSLSAIILGGIFTSLPLGEYYQSRGFFEYFGNIVGVIKIGIPSVVFPFSHIDINNMNGNLWTLPAEFHSYVLMAILMASGLIFKRNIFTSVFLIYSIIMVGASVFYGMHVTSERLPAEVNIYYFAMGVLFYTWRDKIMFHYSIFIISLVLGYALMFSERAVYVYPALLVYVTIFIGLADLPQSKLLKSGDYSYGYYLYGYPISQALLTTVPAFRDNLLLFLPSAIIATGAFAFLSWHLIEKRFLRLRTRFSIESAKIAMKLHPSAFKIEDE
jgi:peptidoglycan/LPS O-acetylase OafA/YrhL